MPGKAAVAHQIKQTRGFAMRESREHREARRQARRGQQGEEEGMQSKYLIINISRYEIPKICPSRSVA